MIIIQFRYHFVAGKIIKDKNDLSLPNIWGNRRNKAYVGGTEEREPNPSMMCMDEKNENSSHKARVRVYPAQGTLGFMVHSLWARNPPNRNRNTLITWTRGLKSTKNRG